MLLGVARRLDVKKNGGGVAEKKRTPAYKIGGGLQGRPASKALVCICRVCVSSIDMFQSWRLRFVSGVH